MSGADTAWMLTSTVLVLFMTLPGLALFYAGLVRASNVLSVLMHCFALACLMSILWLLLGYSVAFGDGGGANAVFGGFGKAALLGVGRDSLSGTIPETVFFMFQMTFAIITPALIVGAYPERVRFPFVLAFSAVWLLIVYAPVTHWVWGGGGLAEGVTVVSQFGVQLLGVVGVVAWTGIATFAIIKVLMPLTGLRVDTETEIEGLDITRSEGEMGSGLEL